MIDFIQQCVDGTADSKDIDDAIADWHTADQNNPLFNKPLREFLGMSDTEYSLWIHDPSIILQIIANRSLRRIRK